MELFISYPHDDNEPFIRHVADDLRPAGHIPNFDRDFIPKGHDWRRRITAKIRETDWTLAFLSRHALDSSVCRNEIDITIGEKGWALTPIKVERVSSTDFPPAVRPIQAFDFSDWSKHGKFDSRTFNAWYQPKLAELKTFLAEDHNTTHAAQMATLHERLARPAPQDAEIDRRAEGFIGREWLLAALESWRHDPARNRLLWLSAAPGMGKSTFAAWLAHTHRANVIAIRLCKYDENGPPNPSAILRAIAWQIARRLPDYRDTLLRSTEKPLPDKLRELAATLLTHPLGPSAAIDGNRSRDPFLVIIDGLDETIANNASPLTTLLTEIAPDLPDWLAIMVTSRPDSPVRDLLQGAHPLPIPPFSPENLADIDAYVRAWLPTLPNPPTDLEAAVAKVSTAAEGNMNYLDALRKMAPAGPEDLNNLPPGLGSLYYSWFERQFPTQEAFAPAKTLLTLLAAARAPFPLPTLAEAANFTPHDLNTALLPLGSLLTRRNDTLAPFHLSLRDWLTAKPPFIHGRFTVDPTSARTRLFSVLWDAFLTFAKTPDAEGISAFVHSELPDLILARQPSVLRADIPPDDQPLTIQAAARCAGAAEHVRNWKSALDWHAIHTRLAGDDSYEAALAEADRARLFVRIGNLAAAHTALSVSLTNIQRLTASEPTNIQWQSDLSAIHERRGDIQRDQGDIAASLQSYESAQTIAAKLAAADADNPKWQAKLAAIQDRIGDIHRHHATLQQAIPANQIAMDIAVAQAEAAPDDAERQYNLGVAHEKRGDLQRAQGDLPAALTSFQTAMDLATRLAAADLPNPRWQRFVSVVHIKIGEVHQASGLLENAMRAFKAAQAIVARLAALDPDNTEWRRDLSVTHIRIGDVLHEQDDAAASRESYLSAMDIRAGLAATDRDNTEWQRDLAITHDRLGDIHKASDNHPAALAAYQSALEIRTRLATIAPGSSQWQRDVTISHSKIADIEKLQHRLHASLQSYRSALAIAARFATADRGNTAWQRDLVLQNTNIGDIQRSMADFPAALLSYRTAMTIAGRLVGLDRTNRDWQRDLHITHERLASIHAAQNDRTASAESLRRALTVLRDMEKLAMKLDAELLQSRKIFPFVIEAAQSVTTTHAEFRRLFKLPPPEDPSTPPSAIPALRAALARNALAEAATILETAPPSPALPNARAVLALRQGNPRAALAHLAPILHPNNTQTPPDHTPDAWIITYATAHALTADASSAERALEHLKTPTNPAAQRLRAAIATARKSQTLLQRLKGAPLPPIQLENPGEL